MTRWLCALAVLVVAAVPGRAPADYPCWAPPPPCGYGYPVTVYPVYPLPVYPAYPPVAATPARPAPARAPLAPPTIAPAAAAVPNALPKVEPAAIPPAFADPRPAPAPEAVRPAAATVPEVPATRPALPKPPSSDLLPPAGLPVAPPVTAPSAGDAKKPEALPPLVLPPDVPGGPSGVVPGTTARFRPAGGPLVEVLAVEGAAGAVRKVGFFNHTGKAIELVVDGKPVTLPRKSYLHAEVPPAFKWRYDGNPAETATVPEDAAGLDVVFRE